MDVFVVNGAMQLWKIQEILFCWLVVGDYIRYMDMWNTFPPYGKETQMNHVCSDGQTIEFLAPIILVESGDM